MATRSDPTLNGIDIRADGSSGDDRSNLIGLPDARIENSLFVSPSFGAVYVKEGHLGGSASGRPPTLVVAEGWQLPPDVAQNPPPVDSIADSGLLDTAAHLEPGLTIDLPTEAHVTGGALVPTTVESDRTVKTPPRWVERLLG
jgi:hypothetical protein